MLGTMTSKMPKGLKRALSEDIFFTPNVFAPDLSVEDIEFDFFEGSSMERGNSHSEFAHTQLPIDNKKKIFDSPTTTLVGQGKGNQEFVENSPEMDKLSPNAPKPDVETQVRFGAPPQPLNLSAQAQQQSSVPQLPPLPQGMHGPVAVTGPLRGDALGIRCVGQVDTTGEGIPEEGTVRNVWYCDRPFPRFEVQLFDRRSGRPVEPLDPSSPTNQWAFQLTILDGNGNDASDKVYGQITDRDFPIGADGMASVAGIRFSAVSSKAGGSFQLAVTLKTPSEASALVVPWKSEPIQVLSYRLFHSPKVPFEKLKAEDPISKMKGIGSLYAKRFSAIGVRTVNDLAHIDLSDNSPAGVERIHVILGALRKDRGAMTMTKLGEYVAQARSILTRQDDSPEQEQLKPSVSVNSSAFLPSSAEASRPSMLSPHARFTKEEMQIPLGYGYDSDVTGSPPLHKRRRADEPVQVCSQYKLSGM